MGFLLEFVFHNTFLYIFILQVTDTLYKLQEQDTVEFLPNLQGGGKVMVSLYFVYMKMKEECCNLRRNKLMQQTSLLKSSEVPYESYHATRKLLPENDFKLFESTLGHLQAIDLEVDEFSLNKCCIEKQAVGLLGSVNCPSPPSPQDGGPI